MPLIHAGGISPSKQVIVRGARTRRRVSSHRQWIATEMGRGCCPPTEYETFPDISAAITELAEGTRSKRCSGASRSRDSDRSDDGQVAYQLAVRDEGHPAVHGLSFQCLALVIRQLGDGGTQRSAANVLPQKLVWRRQLESSRRGAGGHIAKPGCLHRVLEARRIGHREDESHE